jgi:organic hydroperoxide reductase OsmC/OhrA
VGRRGLTEKIALVVKYNRVNQNVHNLLMDSQVMGDIAIDAIYIPPDAQTGTSAKLLGAACLNCFVETFADAMEARGALVNKLQGTATILKGQDDHERTKVSSIEIQVMVSIEDVHLPQFEKCKKIMNRACLITYSIESSINISSDIQRLE